MLKIAGNGFFASPHAQFTTETSEITEITEKT